MFVTSESNLPQFRMSPSLTDIRPRRFPRVSQRTLRGSWRAAVGKTTIRNEIGRTGYPGTPDPTRMFLDFIYTSGRNATLARSVFVGCSGWLRQSGCKDIPLESRGMRHAWLM